MSCDYPPKSLDKSIRKLILLHTARNKSPTTYREAIPIIGFTSYNGAFGQTISSMEKFGLINIKLTAAKMGLDKLIEVTDLGENIIKRDENYLKLLEKSAFLPSLFQELREYFGENEFPSRKEIEETCARMGYSEFYTAIAISYSFYVTLKFLKRQNLLFGVEKNDPRIS
jgi:hypothetical protein